jgi:argininosuccinate lyase
MPFRKAHALVGALVAEAQTSGESLWKIAAAALASVSPAVAAKLASLFDPAQAVRAKAVGRGAAPAAVRASLETARARVRAAS